MSWDNLLYLSILGPVMTVSALAVVTHLGLRFRSELPKLPIKESIEALKLERDEQEARLGELQDKHAEARDAIREGERMQAWLNDHKPAIEQAQREIAEAQDAQRKADAERDQATKALEDVKASLGKASEELTALEKEVASTRIELAELTAKFDAARQDLADFEEKKEERDRLAAQLPALLQQEKALKQSAQDLRAQVDSMQAELKPLRLEHARLSGEVGGMQERRDTLAHSIEDLQRTLVASGGRDEDHDPCEDLWAPYFETSTKAASASNEIERLDWMKQALDSAQVRLPKRALYAFHTALKIQEISPLTVLAGISGTGKSLLPRLYAKCMGMHFLNLPVQPGWSSPQDIFGFYNYIEHKFKATPLARAMVQFDQFNRKEWNLDEKNPALQDQVLMVLLDEMNLARVEYYFSELLSRLEMRRSIDTTNAAERQKVEIPLEIGHGFQGRAERSLYPGKNVLFTGTMNEDESTMSLSDKVLDRATVLRFGKPARLIESQPDLSKIGDHAPLAYSTWQAWVGDGATQGASVETLKEIEEVMRLAGSPFGHRVAQGMVSYVAGYPDSSPQGQRFAWADQIEQKILPKLRGKELTLIDDALRKLEAVVGDLGDAKLAEAMREGHNETEGTFMWIGLDRDD